MAYYLGKDVELVWSTENTSRGATVNVDGELTAEATVLPVSGAVALAAPNFADNAMADITGLDLSIGATDEDVAFLGVRTPLKAEVHKETTVTITKKKGNKVWDVMFASGARWGIDSDNAFYDGLTQPSTDFGYRLFIMLKDGEETFVVRSGQMNSHTVSLNADGTQEETIEFVSSVQPKIYPDTGSSGIATAVGAGEL